MIVADFRIRRKTFNILFISVTVIKICTVSHDDKTPRCFFKDVAILISTTTKLNRIFHFNFNSTISIIIKHNNIPTRIFKYIIFP